MTTYLKRFYFDDAKLRERALIELVYAFETGRMIAFVGSMATESLGYGGWKDLVRKYVERAIELAERTEGRSAEPLRREAAVEAVQKIAAHAGSKFIDRQVAMTTVHEALAFLDEVDPIENFSRVASLEDKAAELFGARDPAIETPPAKEQVIRALVEDLRIRRFATLNYDLEIEAALMVDGDAPADNPGVAIDQLRRLGEIKADPKIAFRLSRLRLNGLSVESDIRDRQRPDRLLSFAVGSPEIDYGIMHLHGRADKAKTMVVGLRDYDELYRKNNSGKVPFEQGQRVLFAGNPVLFVGAGMTEPEVNMTLQAFVSNSPYRRFAPTFLLWSTAAFDTDPEKRKQEIWLKRIDFFRRLGVLTIFDEDLRPDGVASPGDQLAVRHGEAWAEIEGLLVDARPKHAKLDKDENKDLALAQEVRTLDLKVLARATSLVGLASNVRERALRGWRGPWRSLAQRFDAVLDVGHGDGKPISLWGTKSPKFRASFVLKPLFATTSAGRDSGIDFRHRVIVGPPGSGKGTLAWEIAHARNLPGGFQARPHRRLVVNAGFALDTDFLLLAISRFLLTRSGKRWCEAGEISREEQFDQPDAFEVRSEPALIVINGMDRFFSAAGAPLSAEFDRLLRRIVKDRTGNVRWLFVGGRRIERYFRFLSEPAVFTFDQVCPRRDLVAEADGSEALGLSDPKDLQAGPRDESELTDVRADREHINSIYFDRLVAALNAFAKPGTVLPDAGDRVVLEAYKRSDPKLISRAVVSTYVNVKVFERAQFADAPLAMEILRAMAFIGTPIEAVVLLHVPRVRKRLQTAGLSVELFRKVLKQLQQVHLVMEISHFEEYPGKGKKLWRRVGLHTAVSSELRHQFGVPISESKLSTSFNMSLFIAQPVDGFTPEAAIHEELGHLIDRLIGAYKDDPFPEELETLVPSTLPPDASKNERARYEKERARCGPYATAALRAALAVVRSYYSTTSLLTMDRSHRDPSEDKDGVLLEHAERIETLIRVYRKLNDARARYRGEEEGTKELGPDPFYPDDLVWLLNELGVVYLAQGDLYAARRNFDQALKVNSETVEFRSHSHNWRRISLNRVLLHIERGGIFEAESLMRKIEVSVNARPGDLPGTSQSRFDYVRRRFGERAPESRSCFDRNVMHEEVLVTALVLGHRALCHHLRGNLLTAEPLYKEAIAILRRLGENRAYAFFQRHYSQLHSLLDREDRGDVHLELAVAAAESVRQMDMAYHARINQADAAWRRGGADLVARRAALRHLADAADYGALMDLHRIRVEAGIHLAALQLDSGDYESALHHAAEAMALAAKHGMTLRKINLRLIIGHILIRRGDRLSGAAMIDGAVEAADRFGYQRGVEAAQKIRVAEEIGT